MAANDADNQNKPARPSWETAVPPATPRSVAPRPAALPSAYAPPPSMYTPPVAPEPASSAPSYAAPLSDPDVQYDLAGNPIVRSTPVPSPAPYAPPAPFGYSAGPAAPAPGVWPPPLAGRPQAYRNNSGEQSHLPSEIECLRWHWGAFFFPILWTKKHGLTTMAGMLTGGLLVLRLLRMVFVFISPLAYLGICVFYGVAYFGLQVYLGLNGHKIGWRNRHFPGGIDEYFKVQNAWMWWGFGVNIAIGIVLPVLLTLGVIGAGLSGAHAGRGYGSGNSYSSPSYSSSPADNSGNSNGSGQ